ncbi:hypothetical protein [Streptomyces sp. NPDC058086]|uniref:hypothetical protein n=1 Tax=Streptomyces sp. NPDC058086 TaxID=3346334 RepID=UPI0036E6D8E8
MRDATPEEVQPGIRTLRANYRGNDRKTGCKDTAQLYPVGTLDRTEAKTAVATLAPTGWTPVDPALLKAADDLDGGEGTRRMVLINDGEDTCQPLDPCEGIGSYIRLGPLGTAMLPSDIPLVLLIDELDKSDIDLSNDLLNVLEEGEFALPELEQVADRLPGGEAARAGDDLITQFLERSRSELVAADQLLNAIYLTDAAALRVATASTRLPTLCRSPSREPTGARASLRPCPKCGAAYPGATPVSPAVSRC